MRTSSVAALVSLLNSRFWYIRSDLENSRRVNGLIEKNPVGGRRRGRGGGGEGGRRGGGGRGGRGGGREGRRGGGGYNCLALWYWLESHERAYFFADFFKANGKFFDF
ncbi:hypothetical protein O3M35_013309 [Rhynocoris fuscipes]|uniref:Uncharacterized protein n=1 Tax=Rhynocoris fuscipes TaxID=488301 RepID=A0AAW1CEI1_9HEMI